ncbi:MAG TPA: hypothetical protein VKV27_10025 [Solirubrobacteraceae bacterium]|nr:hypothetical protein [Solirubrobacteraceae bacterium]
MSLFQALASLPVEIDGYELHGLMTAVSSGFERHTTVISMRGGGVVGVGEDVVYSAEDQLALQRAGPVAPLTGRWALGELCEHIDALDLFPAEPQHGEVSRLYRRWAFQSAALDLALRQAGRSLHDAIGRQPRPVRFVVSLRLGEPPTLEPIERLIDLYPDLRFKLDATSSWTDELVSRLAQLGVVEAIDFKAHYSGTVVDQPPDAALYARVAAAFPHAWLEDPDVTHPATAAVLATEQHRITWDAPIHSVEDVKALAFQPRMVNVKPSRLGGLRPLLELYEYCEARGIATYGGGQFELGPGRGQAQYLASLYHPGAPNDLAPAGFNLSAPPPGLPSSPLPVSADRIGFRWGELQEPD